MACSRNAVSRARRYVYSGGTGGTARNTMNSVDPQPTVSLGSDCTKAVLPFSRHGVIRANSVSPLRKRVPDLNSRKAGAPGLGPDMGRAAISRYGAKVPFFIGSRGFSSTASPNARTSHPSGTSPPPTPPAAPGTGRTAPPAAPAETPHDATALPSSPAPARSPRTTT